MDSDQDAGRRQRPGLRKHAVREAEGERPVGLVGYQLLRRIGRGSYGEVWLARHDGGGYRAIKVVHRKSFDHDRPFARELSGIRRFQPLSHSHEGLIRVLEVGVDEQRGCFHYVMELGDDEVSGQEIAPWIYSPRTLAKEIQLRGKLPYKQCLRIGLTLSRALEELHAHGLVHRDVKPSNIIFVGGVPKLADLGLVAMADEARSYVGTEGFIPPEGPGTPKGDIYSLGKVLYEAGMGKDRKDFPELPTRLDTFSDHDLLLELNEVILRACRNDATKRYQSARELHSDLLVLDRGESVKRRRLREGRKSALKKAAVGGLLLFMTAALAWYQSQRQADIPVATRQDRVRAEIADGNRAMEAGDLLGSVSSFVEALRLDQGDATRELPHRLRIGSALSQCPKLEGVWYDAKDIVAASFSPDGMHFLLTGRHGRARIFEVEAGNAPPGWVLEHNELNGAEYSPDGQWVVTASGDGSAKVWKLGDGSPALSLEHPGPVCSARFSPDGSNIVTACSDGHARIWDARTGKLTRVLAGHHDAVTFAGYSHNGGLLVSVSRDGAARLWDAQSGLPVGRALMHPGWVSGAAFSPDDRRIVTSCSDYKARVWEVPAGRLMEPELDPRDGIVSAEFSPDGRWILTASLPGTARLWNSEKFQPVGWNSVLGHCVTHACFDGEGCRVLTTCSDGTVRIWNLAGGGVAPEPLRMIPSENGERFLTLAGNHIGVVDTLSGGLIQDIVEDRPFLMAQFNSNGRFILTVCDEGTSSGQTDYSVRVRDAMDGRALARPLIVSGRFRGAALSEAGSRLATFAGNEVQYWDVRTAGRLGPTLIEDAAVRLVVFNRDASRALVVAGNRVDVRDPVSGRAVFRPLAHPGPVVHAEFSPDGSRIVTACADDELNQCVAQVWDAVTGMPLGEPLRHNDGVLFASFSPDGKRVVTASEDFTAMVWDAARGEAVLPPLQHEQQVETARFSPGGDWIVTTSRDRMVRVWDAATGNPLTPPLRHLRGLKSALFLPGGRHVLALGPPDYCFLWRLSVDERPMHDLWQIGRLFSNLGFAHAQPSAPARPELLPVYWRRLRDKYPSSFIASAEEMAAWHGFQAREAEAERQWFAAAFHLKRILALRPDDKEIFERLHRAAEGLAIAAGSGNADADDAD